MKASIMKHSEVWHRPLEWRQPRTFYMVEASDYEKMTFWQDWALDSSWGDREHKPTRSQRISWEQVNPGWSETIGKMKVGNQNMPICVSLTFDLIGGLLVCFYEATSQVVDYRVVEKYVHDKKVWPAVVGRTDAMNFGQCINAIREATKFR